MTFRQATKIMGDPASGDRQQAYSVIKAEMLKTSTRGKGGIIDNLGDWITCQGWSGKETAEELVEAWDNETRHYD